MKLCVSSWILDFERYVNVYFLKNISYDRCDLWLGKFNDKNYIIHVFGIYALVYIIAAIRSVSLPVESFLSDRNRNTKR